MKLDNKNNPILNGITLEELLEEFTLIPKQMKFGDKNIQNFLDCFSNVCDEVMNETYDLKNYCIVKRHVEKKLNNDIVQKIKDDDLPYRQIAKKYKISIGTVSKIKNNKY